MVSVRPDKPVTHNEMFVKSKKQIPLHPPRKKNYTNKLMKEEKKRERERGKRDQTGQIEIQHSHDQTNHICKITLNVINSLHDRDDQFVSETQLYVI